MWGILLEVVYAAAVQAVSMIRSSGLDAFCSRPINIMPLFRSLIRRNYYLRSGSEPGTAIRSGNSGKLFGRMGVDFAAFPAVFNGLVGRIPADPFTQRSKDSA